jgi:hypothetical protein
MFSTGLLKHCQSVCNRLANVLLHNTPHPLVVLPARIPVRTQVLCSAESQRRLHVAVCVSYAGRIEAVLHVSETWGWHLSQHRQADFLELHYIRHRSCKAE